MDVIFVVFDLKFLPVRPRNQLIVTFEQANMSVPLAELRAPNALRGVESFEAHPLLRELVVQHLSLDSDKVHKPILVAGTLAPQIPLF